MGVLAGDVSAVLAGVGAGALLCFIPIVGEFVIPDLLAGSGSMMIGQTLWLEFFTNKDWPVAAAAAVALLVLLVPPFCSTTGCSVARSGSELMARKVNGSRRSTSPRSRWGWRFCICRS